VRSSSRCVALTVACLAARCAVCSGTDGEGQDGGQQGRTYDGAGAGVGVKQVAVTEKQVQAVLAASKEMDAITDKNRREQQAGSQDHRAAEGVAKKNGLASYEEYNNASIISSLCAASSDQKKYVGAETVIKRRSPRSTRQEMSARTRER